MNKILLTGSSGFIGSYFAKQYEKKYKIKFFSFRKDNIDELNLNETDTIIHLSALVHKMRGATYQEYEYFNITQTLDLAKKAKNNNVKHFIFMSTVKVYGEESNIAYCENSICNPQDDYGKSKLKAEQELLKLENNTFKISIIRTPIVYGYGVKANIKNLIKLVEKISILPFAYINNKRSMVYIGNLCHLIDEIIMQKKRGIFLACDDKVLSTTTFINLIAKSLDKKIFMIRIPFFKLLLKKLKPSFYKRLYENLEINNTKTKNILNLKNPYRTEDSINYMIKGEN